MAARITISVDDDLADAIRKAAKADELSVSAWLSRSAQRSVNNQRLLEYLAEDPVEDGPERKAVLRRVEELWPASR